MTLKRIQKNDFKENSMKYNSADSQFSEIAKTIHDMNEKIAKRNCKNKSEILEFKKINKRKTMWQRALTGELLGRRENVSLKAGLLKQIFKKRKRKLRRKIKTQDLWGIISKQTIML